MDQYDKLPKDVQEAIFSAESAKIIQKIGQDYKLNVRQVGILADEAGLLMLGVNGPQDFVKNLTSRLEVDKDTVQKITQEVNSRIFAKIRESLRKIHEIPPKNNEKEKEGDKRSAEDNSTPMAHIIKPRTAPFVVSPKKQEETETPTPFPPVPTPVEAPPAEPEKKDIIDERKKEEGFRSKPSFTEIKPPDQKDLGEAGKAEPQKEPLKKPGYKGGPDPYREPVD